MNNLKKNLITSVLPQLVNIITNLILPGLIIVKFGSEINGLISTTRSIISYISLVGAGIATSVTQALYEPVANKDVSVIKGMLKSANKMFNRYGFIYVVITLIIAFFYPYIIETDINYITIVLLLIVMSLSGASEFFAIGRCRSLLYAHKKVYVCSIVQAISLMLSLLLAIFMLKLDVNIIGVQLAISLVYVLRGFFLTMYVNRNYPEYLNFKNVEPIDSVIEKRNDAMIHQLSGLAVTSSQVTILTLFVGLKAASIYSVYNVVLSGIKMICSNICTSITPFLGNKYALKERVQLRKMYNILELFFFAFVTFFLSVTGVMIISFVFLYTKDSDISYIYPLFAILFVVSTSFYIFKLPATALINVAGYFKETRGRALLEAILSLVCNLIFTALYGLNGVLIGTGIALGWRCLDSIVYSSRNILEMSSMTSIRRLIISLLTIITFCFLGSNINYMPGNYVEWVIMAIFVSIFVIGSLLCEMIIFDRQDFFVFVRYIKSKK